MIYVSYALVALIGAGIHLWRHPAERGPAQAVEVVLLWWIVVVATISLWGDAFGHIHQEIVNDNHDPDNTGPVLYADILVPLVALVLYIARERLSREQRAA